jgi:hypothetical protein
MCVAARRLSLRFPSIHLSPRELIKGKLIGHLKLTSEGSNVLQLVSHAGGAMQFATKRGYLAATLVEGKQGVVQTQQFFLSTKDSNIRGGGYVDLRLSTINYRFKGFAKDFSIGSVPSTITFPMLRLAWNLAVSIRLQLSVAMTLHRGIDVRVIMCSPVESFYLFN